jgi:hypothetical protein
MPGTGSMPAETGSSRQLPIIVTAVNVGIRFPAGRSIHSASKEKDQNGKKALIAAIATANVMRFSGKPTRTKSM